MNEYCVYLHFELTTAEPDSCMSLQAEGTETILVPLQLLLGTGRLLLEATTIQLMVLGASFRHRMENGFFSVGLSPGYESWAFLGSTQEECL